MNYINYNDGVDALAPVEVYMLGRNYAPICNPDSSVKAWQLAGNDNARRLSPEQAERMMNKHRLGYRRLRIEADQKRKKGLGL